MKRIALLIVFISLFHFAFSQEYPQHKLIIYDGSTGIDHCHIDNDTLLAIGIIRNTPAYDAGIEYEDQIIEINGVTVSGNGTTLQEAYDLLFNSEGTKVSLVTKHQGEKDMHSHTFTRVPYADRIANSGFNYLIDPAKQLQISDVISDTISNMFLHNAVSSMTIDSIAEGSNAEKLGLLPGDIVISLFDEVNNHEIITLDHVYIHELTNDTSLAVLRGNDTLQINANPSKAGALKGITSKIKADNKSTCMWLKLNTISRIQKDISYLLDIEGRYDSLMLYEVINGSVVSEKYSGPKVSRDDREIMYKNWTPVSITFRKDQQQEFYIRLVSERSFTTFAYKMIPIKALSKYDRLERMFLSAFLGIMLIIGLYYLIFYFTSRDRSYLWYSLFILLFGMALYIDEEYLYEVSKFGNTEVFSAIESMFYTLPPMFFMVFGIAYLELRSSLKFWYRTSMIILILAILLDILFLFYDFILTVEASVFMWHLEDGKYYFAVLVAYVVLIIPAIIKIRRGFKPAWYFIIASVILIASQFYYANTYAPFNMHNSSTLIVTLINNTGPYLACIITFLIFSIGIAQKMRIAEREMSLAQEQLIMQLKENEKLKDKVNRELEEKVKLRTEKISEQKEEIESQLEEIATQRDELMTQRDMVTAQKEEITDSINYAERIQRAVLPNDEYLEEIMPEYFVLYKPRDIVSGDFYWIKEIKHFLIVIAADCTGHGVPGAFMSMLGISILNEQIGKSRFDKPGEILDRIRKKVKQTLSQKGISQEQKDGMDMAIAILDKETKELQFAGAFNPLYLIRSKNGDKELEKHASMKDNQLQLFELKGDRQPIGVYYKETDFTTRIIQLQENDSIYMFSDGYADQMGGPRGKKFMSKNFKKSLLGIQQMKMPDQEKFLDQRLEEWRQGFEQVDDILVIGIRV